MDQGPTKSEETVKKPTNPTEIEGDNDQDSAHCTKSTNLEPVSPLLSPPPSDENTFRRRKSGPKTLPKPTKSRTNSGDYGQPIETLLATSDDNINGKIVDNAATELLSPPPDAEDIKSTGADPVSGLQIPTIAEGNTPLRRRSGPKTHPKPKGYRKSEYHGQTPEISNFTIKTSVDTVDNTTAGAASELSPPLKENLHVRQRDQDLSASFDELSHIDDSGKSSEKREVEDGRTRSLSDVDRERYLHEPNRGHSQSLSDSREEKMCEDFRGTSDLQDTTLASDQLQFSEAVNVGTISSKKHNQGDDGIKQAREIQRKQMILTGRQRSLSDTMDEEQFAALRASHQQKHTATADTFKPLVPPKSKTVLRRSTNDLSFHSENTTKSAPYGLFSSDVKAKELSPAMSATHRQISVGSDCKKKHSSDLTESDDSEIAPPPEYRIVLVGRSGEGKSSTANTIFGYRVFEAKASAEAVTPECQYHKDIIEGRQLFVVDTPGLFDTRRSNSEIKPVILKFIGITSPGPHVILLVMKVGRFTEEVGKTYEHVRDLLGNEGHHYTILVLTGGDDLENDNMKVEEYLNKAPEGLKQILKDTGHRYVLFNNRVREEDRIGQVSDLLRQIDDVIKVNQGGWYRSAAYEAAELALREKEREEREAIIKQRETEKIRLETRLEEKQSEIDRLEEISKQREQNLERKNQALVEAEQSYEAKMKLLKADYETRLIKVREETRKDIRDNKLNVSQPWFTKRFKEAGKKLKDMIGL